mmetsp:Transcript_120676/g.341901  ORF Transcript_120676/g.341901 Transcript_120676/m.341901 type:complete len:641 (+) Transcript_120676:115-2037(+)
MIKDAVGKVASTAQSSIELAKQGLHEWKNADLNKASFEGATHVLFVEACTAVDLRETFPSKIVATCDAYCVVALGRADAPWATKSQNGKAATRVVVQQRHPVFGSQVALPVRELPDDAEVSIRVMDSENVGNDLTLGEVRIAIVGGRTSGAECLRLCGSGFATLSLRWALLPMAGQSRTEHVQLPRGSAAFEEALDFWMPTLGKLSQKSWAKLFEKDDENQVLETATRELTSKLSGSNKDFADALLFQAPLMAVLGKDDSNSVRLLSVIGSLLPSLHVETRARLAGALVERLSNSVGTKADQQMLVDLFTDLSGEALTELKRLIDTAGVGLDLVVLYETLADRLLKGKLVTHFMNAANAEEVEASSCCFFKSKKRTTRPGPTLHVLSDIDMTFWVGKFGSGGPKFPQGMIPGSRPLLKALGGQLTFLSARPALVESQTRRELMEVGAVEIGLLKGSLAAVLMAPVMKKEAHVAMGERKAEAFVEFIELHPEARFVFFGDSGEGDVDFAAGRFSESAAPASQGTQPSNLALIHDVVDEEGVMPRTPASRREELRARGVYFFDSYAGAALVVYENGLLTAPRLREAVQGCHDEFEAIEASKFSSKKVYAARCAELVGDINRVDAALKDAGVQPIDRRTQDAA